MPQIFAENRKRNEVKEPKFVPRTIFSVIFVVIAIIALKVYSVFRASLEAQIAVGQLNDSVVEYSFIQQLIVRDAFDSLVVGIFILVIILTWYRFIKYQIKNN